MIFGNRDDKERVYLNALKTANTYNLKVLAVMVFLSILALVLNEIGVFATPRTIMLIASFYHFTIRHLAWKLICCWHIFVARVDGMICYENNASMWRILLGEKRRFVSLVMMMRERSWIFKVVNGANGNGYYN